MILVVIILLKTPFKKGDDSHRLLLRTNNRLTLQLSCLLDDPTKRINFKSALPHFDTKTILWPNERTSQA